MTKLRISAGLGVAALAIVAVSQFGCGGAGIGTSSFSYLGTQAPGDVWNWTLTPTTFTATNETLSHNYSGSAASLPSGFKKLTIATSDDVNVPVGSNAYAIEIPGVALAVKPAGADTQPPIMATRLGNGPSGTTASFNWVEVPRADWDATTREGYGSAVFTKNGDTWDGVIQKYLMDGTDNGQASHNFTVSGGRLIVDGGTDIADMTPAGIFFIDFGPGMGGVIGVPTTLTNVDTADLASNVFRGLLVKSGHTEPVWAHSNGAGALLGGGFDGDAGLETNTINPDPNSGVTITFTGQPRPGCLQANLHTNDGHDEAMVVVVNKVNGKYVLYGVGGGVTNDPGYNVVMVQQ